MSLTSSFSAKKLNSKCSKTKLAVAVSTVCLFLSQSAYAVINEIPIADKQYDEYLYYDAEGSKKFSLQGSETGKQHNYYFNEGATLDASNGGNHAAILVHNWGGFNTETAEIFHVGSGKEFVVKSYENGKGTLIAEEGANLKVIGGNVVLESGIKSTSGMDNTASSIHMESSGVLKIEAESMWMGNKRTDDRHNVGAISMAGDANTVDIDVTGTFTAENVDMGIALQTKGSGTYAVADVHAGGNISINAHRSDGDSASGYRGSGIYSMAYYAQDSSSTTSLISDYGNISIDAQGYAIYAYGNTPTSLKAEQGSIILHSTEKHGIYSKGYFDKNSNKVELSAQTIDIVSDINYGVYSSNSEVILNSARTLKVESSGGGKDGRALYSTENGKIQATSSTVTISGDKYGIYASKEGQVNVDSTILNIGAQNGFSVCLFSGANADFIASSATYNEDIYVDNSQLYVNADDNNINGQIQALDGGKVIVASKTKGSDGYVKVVRQGSDAVTAVSDTEEAASILFKQRTYINSQEDEIYYADKQGIRTDSAIRAKRNSDITLELASGIYGDVIAGYGEVEEGVIPLTETGGKISVKSVENATFKGDYLAGNGGKIDLTLNRGASLEGRIDDYNDATLKNMVFRPGEFDVPVTKGGTVNLTLNNSTWIARGQSFVSKVDFGETGGVIDLTEDKANSVTIRNLTGNGIFNIKLNAAHHENGNMLYIGKNNGHQTVNIIGGIEGLESINEDNPLRFATVGIDGASLPETGGITGTKIRAFTRDAGMWDLEYIVAKEDFDKEDKENEKYNGEGNGEGVNKPGNDFVENELAGSNPDTAVNWIITGVKAPEENPDTPDNPDTPNEPSGTHISDAGKSVIDMSRANYANAVYMDTLNKRQGEARFVGSTDHGVWVRLRHDNIGKDNSFRTHNTMVEVGLEQRDVNDHGEFHTGVALDYMNGQIDYHTVDGDGDIERYGIWFYTTYLGNDGQYADLVLKYGHLKNDFGFNTKTQGEHVTGDYTNEVASLSAEYGWKFSNSYNYYIEPQAQLQYSYVTGADYTTSQGSKVELDSIHSLIGRIGFRAGKDFNTETPITAYIRGDVLHEFLGDQDIYAYDNTGVMDITYENDDTWYTVGLGMTVKSSDNTYFFIEGETALGADNEDTYTVSGGFRHSF